MKKILHMVKENTGIVLTAVGVGTTAAGIILTKKAGVKAKKVLEERDENLKAVQEVIDLVEENPGCVDYSEEDIATDLKIINAKTTVGYVKAYAVPVITTIAGLGLTVNGLFKIKK